MWTLAQPAGPAQTSGTNRCSPPGKKSPSIMPLERGDWVAVSAMVLKKGVAEIIDKLEACGATDILVFDLTNCRV